MWDSLPRTVLLSIKSSCYLCIPGFAHTSQMRPLPWDHWLVQPEAGFNHRNHFLTDELLNTFQESVPRKLMWIPWPTLYSLTPHNLRAHVCRGSLHTVATSSLSALPSWSCTWNRQGGDLLPSDHHCDASRLLRASPALIQWWVTVTASESCVVFHGIQNPFTNFAMFWVSRNWLTLSPKVGALFGTRFFDHFVCGAIRPHWG